MGVRSARALAGRKASAGRGVTRPDGRVELTNTACVASDNLRPPNARRPPTPPGETAPYEVNNSVNGSTTICKTSRGTVSVRDVVHYQHDTSEGAYTVHTEFIGLQPVDLGPLHTTGRYLGPCDDK